MNTTYEIQDSDIEFMRTVKVVDEALISAEKHGLVTEVVVFALKHMKENPSMSIVEAIDEAYYEWVK